MEHLWVIEMYIAKKWLPTIGVEFTRAEARVEKRVWERECPDDKFRIRKYVREDA